MMSDLRKAAMQQAINTIGYYSSVCGEDDQDTPAKQAQAALRAALAEPEQSEPDAYIHRQGTHWELSENPLLDDEKARGWTEEPLFAHPPRREPLTEAQALHLWRTSEFRGSGGQADWFAEGIRAAEIHHGIGVKP
jgi:hypothetical protein